MLGILAQSYMIATRTDSRTVSALPHEAPTPARRKRRWWRR
ncbi:MAG: hypothetical protein OIF47_17180 [Marinibacterium sp.]|nr:hypothetical protein [Marinibacterium sp.]